MKAIIFLLTVLCLELPNAWALKLGAISYWLDESQYDKLPDQSVALINPDNGILASEGLSNIPSPKLYRYLDIVASTTKRGILMLGYVPTGHFVHDCDTTQLCQSWKRIEMQVKTYFSKFPQLGGIFFDEVSTHINDCTLVAKEYQRLREIVSKIRPYARIAFNPSYYSDCIVSSTRPGEILVLFEGSAESYFEQAETIKKITIKAANRSIYTWHLVHTVNNLAELQAVFNQAKLSRVELFYATDMGGNWREGENTWGDLPSFWAQELLLFSGKVITPSL